MDQEKDAVVPGLLALIRDLDQRSTELKRAVNAINRERGEALTFQNGELAGSDAIGRSPEYRIVQQRPRAGDKLTLVRIEFTGVEQQRPPPAEQREHDEDRETQFAT